jgi:hypothetical protein
VMRIMSVTRLPGDRYRPDICNSISSV